MRRGHVHQYLRRANLPCCFVPLARICLTPRDLLARQYLSSLRNPTTRASSAHTQRRSWPRHRIRPPGALKSREAWHISSLSFFLSLTLPPQGPEAGRVLRAHGGFGTQGGEGAPGPPREEGDLDAALGSRHHRGHRGCAGHFGGGGPRLAGWGGWARDSAPAARRSGK